MNQSCGEFYYNLTWKEREKKRSLLLFNRTSPHAHVCVCVRARSRPPPPLGSQCKTSSGSPGGCFILEWAAQWREDGGCFPALKAPQLAPLTNRAASSLWGRLFSELHGDKHTVSLPAPPGSAQPHASPPGHSKLRTTPRQVVHLALSSCLWRTMPLLEAVWIHFTSNLTGVPYLNL